MATGIFNKLINNNNDIIEKVFSQKHQYLKLGSEFEFKVYEYMQRITILFILFIMYK